VRQLDADLESRIAAIARPSSAESKGLAAARKRILRYKGRDDVADFRTLGAVVSLVVSSRTRDDAVRADMRAVIDAMFDRFQRRLDFVAIEVGSMVDPLNVAAIEKAKQVPERLVARARAAIDDDPVRVTALVTKGYDLLGLVLLKAKQLVEKEYGSPPPEGLAVAGPADAPFLQNSAMRSYDIAKVRVFAVVLSGAAEVTSYAGDDARTLIPDLFAVRRSNRIPAAGASAAVFPLGEILLALVPSGTPDARVSGALWIYLKGVPSFFIVPFDVTAP
jgi:hypothetical protein